MSSEVGDVEVAQPLSGGASGRSRRKTESGEKKSFDPKIIAGVAVGAVLLVVFVISRSGGSDSGQSPGSVVAVQPSQQETVSDEAVTQMSEEERIRQELLSAGYGAENSSSSGTKSQIPVESDVFVKDLSGADVKEMFVSKSIVYIKDFVSYTRHRAVTDDGIELYWLEGDYKGKKCRMDIKFKHFQTLSDTGVVMCNIEVVETQDGNKLITWFSPIEDPISALDSR
jgi:hypothetical protein